MPMAKTNIPTSMRTSPVYAKPLQTNQTHGLMSWFNIRWRIKMLYLRFLPPATKFGQGNIFRSVCPHSVHGGGGACMVAAGGACMVALGGMHDCLGGMHGCSWGVHGCSWGVCMGYDEIQRYGQWAGGTHPTGMHSCCWMGWDPGQHW